MIYSSFVTKLTSLYIIGDIIKIVGKETTKERSHAFNQVKIILFPNPKLKIHIIKDIIHDMNNDIRNE